MIVEVPGIWVHNRGALLMLEAIRERLRQAYPAAALAVPVVMQTADRRALGVLGVLPRGGGLANRLKNLLPSAVLRRRGLVKHTAVSVILDASGFGYGDFWGKPILDKRLIDRLRGWRRRNRAAILLPQAFGPFTAPGLAQAFREGVRLQDLVFVRDDVSMRHVRAVCPHDRNVKRAPDFTNLVHPELPTALSRWSGWSFVVPNEKMVAGERAASRADYIAFMGKAAEIIAASGREVAFLVHEGAKDRALVDEINVTLPQPLPVIDEGSALGTKALIASADLLVSSRFHGLVSGLSNAVPSLACGWSHKYAELMRDYGVADLSIDIGQRETWDDKLASFLARADGPDLRAHLAVRGEAQRALSEQMWSDAFAVIAGATGQQPSA